ncbi:uncharacterized protein RHO17_022706 [Thomomys bottae]
MSTPEEPHLKRQSEWAARRQGDPRAQGWRVSVMGISHGHRSPAGVSEEPELAPEPWPVSGALYLRGHGPDNCHLLLRASCPDPRQGGGLPPHTPRPTSLATPFFPRGFLSDGFCGAEGTAGDPRAPPARRVAARRCPGGVGAPGHGSLPGPLDSPALQRRGGALAPPGPRGVPDQRRRTGNPEPPGPEGVGGVSRTRIT